MPSRGESTLARQARTPIPSPSPVKVEGSKAPLRRSATFNMQRQNSLPPSRGKGWGWGAQGLRQDPTPIPDPSPVKGEGSKAPLRRSATFNMQRQNSLPPSRGKGWVWGAQGLRQDRTPIPDPSPVKGEGSRAPLRRSATFNMQRQNSLPSGPCYSRGRSAVRGCAAECPASPLRGKGSGWGDQGLRQDPPPIPPIFVKRDGS